MRAGEMLSDLGPGTNQRVLLINQDKKIQRSLFRLLRCLVSHVDVCDHFSEKPVAAEYDLVICDYDSLSADERFHINDVFTPETAKAKLLLFSDGQCRDDFVSLFGRRTLTNLVANNSNIVANTDLIVTVQKILRKDIFGIEKYFSWGVRPYTMRIGRSRDKDEVIVRARAYAETIGIHSRMVELICSVADEFVTNCIYNAPVNEKGEYRYASLPRTSEVELDAGEEAVLTLCCDGRRLGISATDPFGSLSPEMIQSYLSKCFRMGDDQVDRESGGAGLGLYYVFESLSHFVINISRHKQTEVIGLVNVQGSYRDFLRSGKSFNIFTSD